MDGEGVETSAWRSVPMNASSVIRTDFQQVKRGFAPDEVTQHLGRVAEHVADLETRLQDLEARLLERAQAQSESAGDPYEVVASRVADLVRSFDQDAARLRADARIEAERILAEARGEAERAERDAQTIRQQADVDASRIVSDVTEQAERLVADARREAEELIAGYRSRREALLQDLAQIGEWLSSTSSTLNAVLERATDEVIVVEPRIDEPTQS
jgi:cell division septum initiation protein DivIVA